MKISVINKTAGNTGKLAQNELISLLRQVCPDDIGADLPSPKLTFTLAIEPLESYCWQVREADSDVVRFGEIDIESNRTIGCVGFCWPDYWVKRAMLTYPGSYTAEKIAPVLEKTIKRAEMLSELRRKTKSADGIKTLRLMENRCRCSISHLNAAGLIAQVINKVKAIRAEERSLNNSESASLMSVTDEIERYINDYIDSYAELVPDRGSEGNLVSYVDIYRGCLAHLRTCVIGGIEPCEHWWPHHDSIK